MLPHFMPNDAFQHTRISGKSSKKYKNVDAVMNSNVKGMGLGKVYKEPGKNHIFVRRPIKD